MPLVARTRIRERTSILIMSPFLPAQVIQQQMFSINDPKAKLIVFVTVNPIEF